MTRGLAGARPQQRDGVDEALGRLGKGIALAPLGGAIGTAVILSASHVRSPGWVAVAGVVIGTFLAAPVTCVALPLARGPRHWGGRLMPAWLMIAGGASGVLELLVTGGFAELSRTAHHLHVGIPGVLWRQLNGLPTSYELENFFVTVLAVTIPGAVCGLLFAIWTHRSRPRPDPNRMPP